MSFEVALGHRHILMRKGQRIPDSRARERKGAEFLSSYVWHREAGNTSRAETYLDAKGLITQVCCGNIANKNLFPDNTMALEHLLGSKNIMIVMIKG